MKIAAKQYCDPVKESPECMVIGAYEINKSGVDKKDLWNSTEEKMDW